METADGLLFVRKTAGSREGVQLLRAQTRQIRAIEAVGAPRGLFPAIFAQHDNGYDMEYVEGITLADAEVRTNISNASNLIRRHFELASRLPRMLLTPGVAAEYVISQARLRCARWRQTRTAVETSSDFLRIADRWMDAARKTGHRIGPGALFAASHGDLRPENVVQPSAPTRGLVYIDTRGKDLVWSNGVPYWDLAMDICSFLFSMFVILKRGRATSPRDADRVLIALDEIATVMRHRDADPKFFQRILLYFAIKCIGHAWLLDTRQSTGFQRDIRILRFHLEALEAVWPQLATNSDATTITVLSERLRSDT
jgi:hypothetical protein